MREEARVFSGHELFCVYSADALNDRDREHLEKQDHCGERVELILGHRPYLLSPIGSSFLMTHSTRSLPQNGSPSTMKVGTPKTPSRSAAANAADSSRGP